MPAWRRLRNRSEGPADLVDLTGIGERSSVLEVSCGMGQATRSLAALGCSITTVEPGVGMAALIRLADDVLQSGSAL